MPEPLVDIGANLTNAAFRADLKAVLARARDAGVETILVTGTSVAGSEAALALAETHGLHATAGCHPHDAKHWTAEDGERLRTLQRHPRIVAAGECGLDFDRDFSPRDVQERVFAEQLAIALETGRPLFLHERAASERFLALVRPALRQGSRGVVHCFTGDEHALRAYLDEGLWIGITGWICDERRGLDLRRIARLVPADRLLVETDAPYLLPRDLEPRPRNRRNEPAFLPHVARSLAAARGETFEELARATTANARRLFDLPTIS